MDLFDIAAKITLNTSDYEKNLDEAEDKGKSFSSKLGNALGTAAKVGAKAIGTTIAVAGAGVVAGMTAAIGVAKKATDAYANYEQLVGGLETMFEDLSYDVILNAEQAYKTAGLSANEYMETVMGFSASLNASLLANEGNIARAADLSDQIIRDMSDNANKMGTNMESIQNAYAGFAKQQYNMLDNLKLGYGGTKEEMERLLADAEKLSGQKYDISNFADVAEAIHVIQTEMRITGTTALEAAETISGSGATAKAAWQNLITALGTGENIEESVKNFTDSVKTYIGNLAPVFTGALKGFGTMIREIVPIISKELPSIVNELVPVALEAGISIMTSIASAFPELIPTIVSIINSNLDDLVSAAVTMIPTIGNALIENLPVIANAALDIIMTLLDNISSNDNIGSFIETAFTVISELVTSIAKALPELIPAAISIILQLVEAIIDNIDLLIDAAIELIMGLAEGIINAIPILIEKAPIIVAKLVEAIIRNVPKILKAAKEIIVKLWEGLKENAPKMFDAASEIVNTIGNGIARLWNMVKDWGKGIIDKIWSGLKDGIEKAKTWGKDMIDNFGKGITEKAQALLNKVKDIAGKVKNFLGFSEPKEGPLSDFHTYAPDMMNLFMKGIEDNKRKLERTVADAFDFGGVVTDPNGWSGGPRPVAAGAAAGFSGTIDLYIDKRTLVGSTSKEMDRSLGDIDKIKLRYGGRN